MAISNPETIEIVDESTHDEVKFQLYIDGSRRAYVRKKYDLITFAWEVYGPQYWPEAKVLMQGLLELSVIADQLSGEKNGKKADRDED